MPSVQSGSQGHVMPRVNVAIEGPYAPNYSLPGCLQNFICPTAYCDRVRSTSSKFPLQPTSISPSQGCVWGVRCCRTGPILVRTRPSPLSSYTRLLCSAWASCSRAVCA